MFYRGIKNVPLKSWRNCFSFYFFKHILCCVLFLNLSFLIHIQKHLDDNWTFVEELLKYTCNPRVSTVSSYHFHYFYYHYYCYVKYIR